MSNRDLLEERVEAVMRAIEWKTGEEGPPAFVAVYCNGCGFAVSADNVAELAPLVEEWELDPVPARGTDLCPQCR
jgi:hypothetical protein